MLFDGVVYTDGKMLPPLQYFSDQLVFGEARVVLSVSMPQKSMILYNTAAPTYDVSLAGGWP